MRATARLTDALRGRGKALIYAGTATAAMLAGAGTASAATVSSATVPASIVSLHPAVDLFPARPQPAIRTSHPATHKVAVHTAAVHHATAVVHHAPAAHHASHPAPAKHRAAPARKPRPYLIYDSVTPSSIPAHHEIATYATGSYAVQASQVAGRGPVLWIDTRGTDPAASALDVEPGDASPALAANWAWRKLHADPNSRAIIYTMRSEWGAAQAAIDRLPAHMRSHVRWWIADPTGVPHIVPGANATQWYWGSRYDITTADPGF